MCAVAKVREGVAQKKAFTCASLPYGTVRSWRDAHGLPLRACKAADFRHGWFAGRCQFSSQLLTSHYSFSSTTCSLTIGDVVRLLSVLPWCVYRCCRSSQRRATWRHRRRLFQGDARRSLPCHSHSLLFAVLPTSPCSSFRRLVAEHPLPPLFPGSSWKSSQRRSPPRRALPFSSSNPRLVASTA